MSIEALNCQCCGAPLKIFSSICECEYCGNINIIGGDAGKYINQLNRANKLRQQCEFDHAYTIYENILSEYTPSVEILWSQALCEYGIEYVPDPLSSRYFPTLHRIKDISFLNSRCFTEALELADEKQKKELNTAAEEIARIQEEYLNIAANESPYDVFICYKETDNESGEKTEDVKLAEELYYELTERGFKVFFARETLKDKLSINYEPYIFAALKSAKAMAVIGTKAEYFTAVWVKNEWGRFRKLMETHPEKKMFFACDDPEELPRVFATKQAQLLGENGAIKNLARNIEMFLTGSKAEQKQLLTQDEFDRIMEEKSKEYVKNINRTKFKENERNLMDEITNLSEHAGVSYELYKYSYHVGAALLLSSDIFRIIYVILRIKLAEESVFTPLFVFSSFLSILLLAGIILLFSSMAFQNFVKPKKNKSAESYILYTLDVFKYVVIVLGWGFIGNLFLHAYSPITDIIVSGAVALFILLIGAFRGINPSFVGNTNTFEETATKLRHLKGLEESAKREFFEFAAKQLEDLKATYFYIEAEIKDYHYNETEESVRKKIEEDLSFIDKMDEYRLDTDKELLIRKRFTILYSIIAASVFAIILLIVCILR